MYLEKKKKKEGERKKKKSREKSTGGRTNLRKSKKVNTAEERQDFIRREVAEGSYFILCP